MLRSSYRFIKSTSIQSSAAESIAQYATRLRNHRQSRAPQCHITTPALPSSLLVEYITSCIAEGISFRLYYVVVLKEARDVWLLQTPLLPYRERQALKYRLVVLILDFFDYIWWPNAIRRLRSGGFWISLDHLGFLNAHRKLRARVFLHFASLECAHVESRPRPWAQQHNAMPAEPRQKVRL